MPRESRAREALLDRVVAEFVASGVPTGSMRSVARELGTSYQLLSYHFGDREQLLRAALERIQAAIELDVAEYLERHPDHADPRHLWQHLMRPGANRLRVQNQCVGLALIDPEIYGDLASDVAIAWRNLAEQLLAARGVTGVGRRARATLLVAVLRGLALDIAATGDRHRVDGALREMEAVFVAWMPVA